jgi:sec-independent protein translocase protein TatA
MNFPAHPLAFIDGVGGPEMLLILVIVLMLFGGQKLPELARGLGKSMKEFKKAATGVEEEFKRALQEDEHRHTAANHTPVITSAQPVPALPSAADTPPASDPAASPDGTSTPAETIPPSPVETAAVAATPPPATIPVPAPAPVKPTPVVTAPRRGRADV